MIQLPGWDSVDRTAWWSSFYFWASIFSLLLLGATEVLSHRYGKRHDELVTLVETTREGKREAQHAAEVAALQGSLAAREPRSISLTQHDALVALLTPISIQKGEVLFNPLITDGEAVAFSEKIKAVLKEAGFPVNEVPFGERLMSLNRLGVYLWFKDQKAPPKRANYIYEAFKRVGIVIIGDAQPDFADPEKLVIVVGAHP
jgi:hypothetical protein